MSKASVISSLLRAQHNPFLIIDAECRIRYANSALEEILGFEKAHLLDKGCCQLHAVAMDKCRHQRFFYDLEPYIETQPLLIGNGEIQFAQIHGFPVIDEDGQLYLGESFRLLRKQSRTGPMMVGHSAAFHGLVQELHQAAATDVSILLNGETGSGKELAAHFIHNHSARAQGPFVVVDCTVLSADLFESELFGHVKGAFTGATDNKIGLFELADSGTLFFDEIGELPLSQQPKLLRALETGVFRPVGATKTRRSNVRVVSATHKDLKAMVHRGKFRQDLYYRFAVLPIKIPTLRARREDITILAKHLLEEISGPLRPYRMQKDALHKLLLYNFPGNIRELRNLLQLAAALSPDGVITVDLIRLPDGRNNTVPQMQASSYEPPHQRMADLSPIEVAEAGYILDLLRQHHGNRTEVAANMSISERTLYRKLKRYRLNSRPLVSENGT